MTSATRLVRAGWRVAACVGLVAIAALARADGTEPSVPPPPELGAWSPLDTIFSLPPVEVRGEPLRRRRAVERETLASAVIVPAAESRRLATPAELLGTLPGIELRSLGGMGAFSTASLRGASGQEMAVLVDGVDTRSPFTGEAMIDELPLAGVERLELYRGGAPASLGAGGAAGAVNVVTGGAQGARLSVGAGSFDTRRAGFSAALTGLRDADFHLAAGLLTSDADYRYLDRHGTVISNTADDTLRLRRNADLEARDLLARLRWAPGAGRYGGRWSLAYRYLSRENGVPGTESLPTLATRSQRSGHDWRLGWESPLLLGRAELRAQGFLRRGWTRFLNPLGETGPFLVADETRDRLTSRGATAGGEVTVGALHLQLSGEARREGFLPDNLNPAKPDEFERRRDARRGEAEAGLLVARQRLLLVAAYGAERIEDNYYGPPTLPWLPALERDRHVTRERFRRAGLHLRAVEGPRWQLGIAANVADAYRAPTLLELFGQDVSVSGNPALRPEHGAQSDLGLRAAVRRGELAARGELTWFRRDLEDQILFLRNSQSSVRADNVSASRVTGRELSLSAEWRRWRLRLARTTLVARDRSGLAAYDGKALPYRSPARSLLRLGWEHRRLGLHVEREWRAATFSDRYNDPDRQLPAATLWGAGLNLDLTAALVLSIEGRNLGDARIEDRLGYPLPGRHWQAGLSWALGH